MSDSSRRPLSLAEEAQILELYESGLSCEKIAPLVGRCSSSVSNVLRRCGAAVRGEHHGSASHAGQLRRWGYSSWQAMRQRCFNPKCPKYKDYGGRGITVCDEWRHSFKAFIGYIGQRPSLQHTIDRYPDNNGNYEPGNVRWAVPAQQGRNRRNTHLVETEAGIVPVVDAAEAVGIKYSTAIGRINRGHAGAAILAPKRITPTQCAGDPKCTRKPICKGLCGLHDQRRRKASKPRVWGSAAHLARLAANTRKSAVVRLTKQKAEGRGRFALLPLIESEVTVAQIANVVGKKPNAVRMLLSKLECEGLAQRVGGGKWRRCG